MGLLSEDDLLQRGTGIAAGAHHDAVAVASASNAAAGKSILSMLGRPDGEPPPSAALPQLLQLPSSVATGIGQADVQVAAAAAALQQDPSRQGKTLSVAELFNFAQGKELPPIPQQHTQQVKKDDFSSGDETTQKMQQEVLKMAQVMWASQHHPGAHQGNQVTGGGRFPSSSSSSCSGGHHLQHLQAPDAGRQYAQAALLSGGGNSNHHQHQHNVAAQYRVGQQHRGAQHAASATHVAHIAHHQQAWAHYPYPGSCGGGYAAQQHGWPLPYSSLYQVQGGEPYQHAGDGYVGGLQGAYSGGQAAAALHGMYSNAGGGFEGSAADAPSLPRSSAAEVSSKAASGGVALVHGGQEELGETDAGCSQS